MDKKENFITDTLEYLSCFLGREDFYKVERSIESAYDQGYADAREEMKDDREDPFECGRCGLIHEGECGI